MDKMIYQVLCILPLYLLHFFEENTSFLHHHFQQLVEKEFYRMIEYQRLLHELAISLQKVYETSILMVLDNLK